MRILIFFLLICSLYSCMFFGTTQKRAFRKAEKMKPFDVVIIPGLPLYEGKIDTLLKSRILWSGFLYKKGIAKYVLYSGNAVYTPWIEGTSMALCAQQIGIDKEHILIDTTAEHSTENLYYGYQLAKSKGFKRIAVATDPFQCILLKKYAKKHFKENIYFLPLIYDSIRSEMKRPLNIDTNVTKKSHFIPLDQRQNYKERLRGTQGKNIPK